MLEPEEIVQDLIAAFQPKLLVGCKVLVTAGPTYEAIDPVRGITNLSSGKMGFAIARAAHEAGAEVTVIAGPVHLPTPRGVRRIDVRSAADMHGAVLSHVADASVFVATAAVADWRVQHIAEQKIKKTAHSDTPELQFTENADILGEVAKLARAQSGALFCVGFAAESHDLQKNAQAKREKKGVPLLVGNIGPATFGSDENALLLVDAKGSQEVPQASKLALARKLVAEIAQRMKH
jgi:phosphopantothenoylcysteine decarboxylase/phosphopantothenate--cysteine ligase